MKKNFLSFLFLSIGILFSSYATAQDAPDWATVIKETKGDTLVIRSSDDPFNGGPYFNTIRTAVYGDTAADGSRNPKRVYETVVNEYYISDVSLDLSVKVPKLVLTAKLPVGAETPPIHIRALKADGKKDKTFIDSYGDIYISNQYYCGTFTDDSYESVFSRVESTHGRVIVDNCIFDLTRWVACIPVGRYANYKFTNCKFINIGHEASLEKGLVIETRSLTPDTIWMENNTIINSGGFIMSLNNSALNFGYFNHNTIVNSTQHPFHFHSAAEVIVTNNLLVNAGLVPDYPGFYPLINDADSMPKGVINSAVIDTSWIRQYWEGTYPVAENERKYFVDRNSVYWDPRFEVMLKDSMAAFPDSIKQQWATQMIWMNDRTKGMFDDDDAYPYYNEGSLLNINPDFANNKDLVPEWIRFIVSNAVPGAPNKGVFMPYWRTNYLKDQYLIDWPMLADMSYTNATLKSGALNGYPMGDLNWFPAEKAAWKATNESKVLFDALYVPNSPIGISDHSGSNFGFEVYPNPVTESATVDFTLSKSANVDIRIYNIMGEEVRYMMLGSKEAGNHQAAIEKLDLSSGIYFVTISFENEIFTKKISVK